MSLAHRIATALGGVKPSGQGYQCKCPCHDDKTASLGVIDDVNKQDSVIFNCLAGCSWEDIKEYCDSQGLLERFTKTSLPGTNGRAAHKATEPKQVEAQAELPQQGPIYYSYVNEFKQQVCQKVRLPGKRFFIQRFDGFKWIKNVKGIDVPLYNLPKVIHGETIYICEGEKDCDSLNSRGLVATTNIAGGAHWDDKYNKYFTGKSVVICQDNDETGRARTLKISKALQGIAKEVLVFDCPGVGDKGDVTDWLELGNNANDIKGLSKPPVDVNGSDHNSEAPKRPKQAKRQHYFELFERALDGPKRCIFADKLMTYNKAQDLWNPAINNLHRVKAAAIFANESPKSPKFNLSYIEPYFFEFEAQKEPEFLCQIPEWDKQSRISEMCYLVKLKPEAGVTDIAMSELVKEWCALVFKRLENPMIQNRILVLQGAQGIGKDTWISMLVDGLGQFSIPLSIVKEDKDTYLNLHRGLIMKISEFDKTARAEVSTLKDIITAPSTNLRAPYDRDARLRVNRCSFISSANAENLLRDSTGNRRFLIFEVEFIEYGFCGWSREKIKAWQMQCLAEMRYLALIDYKASDESWQCMHEYIENETPLNPGDGLLEEFGNDSKEQLSLVFNENREISVNDPNVIKIISQIALRHKMSIQGVATMLRKRIGVKKRIGKKRQWVYRIPTEAH